MRFEARGRGRSLKSRWTFTDPARPVVEITCLAFLTFALPRKTQDKSNELFTSIVYIHLFTTGRSAEMGRPRFDETSHRG